MAMQLIHRNPLDLMSVLHRDVDRLFNGDAERSFVPAVDIREEPQRFVVEADLPGVDAKAIDITVDGDTLTIAGERRRGKADEDAEIHLTERARGRFERSFRLPESAASEGFSADYSSGVLTIAIPKTERAIPYRIEVTAN
jgi:HSP20 family protein